MWLFRHKYLADGMLSRYKTRLVANGSTQLEGVDVDETFSLVVKPGLFLSQKKYVVEILDRFSTTLAFIDVYLLLMHLQVCLYMHDPQKPHFSALKGFCEAEYHCITNAVAETCWLRNLLHELHTPLSSATFVYCDNVSAVYLSCNPVQNIKVRSIVKLTLQFYCDLVAVG
ncbi:ribonuclease H-like domain-containing protein [Tanacetum coccineum]|uniref:Ribonuclease H-like domain-containing protein n=1 Tax=Tanacetum coccineum TaxID=301880 RepID=A0ABQ5BAZ2_9ASTR